MRLFFFIIFFLSVSISLQAQLQRSAINADPVNDRHAVSHDEQLKIKSSVLQDFELYDDFSLDFYPWSTQDVDGSVTYGIDGYEFPHDGEPMSFIIFNPASTTPSIAEDPTIHAHSGSKFAACFASQLHMNNDWLISPLIEMGANGLLTFWVKSYTANYGLERYKVGVSVTNPDPSSFTFISGDNYLEAPADAWEQKNFDLSAYAGMDIFVGIQCVSNDAFIFMVDDLEISSTGGAACTLTGKVTDAVTGNPVANAIVAVGDKSDDTDAEGNYLISGIPAGGMDADFTASAVEGDSPLTVQFMDLSTEGTQTVEAALSGYATYKNNQAAIPEGGTLNLPIALSPGISAGQNRIVLSWGETPFDLDAHLKTPEINGSAYNIYAQDTGSPDSPPFAFMDISDQQSFGPETVTVYEFQPGEYHYYVKNISGSPDLSLSQAYVQVYNALGLVENIRVPSVGSGIFWEVFSISGPNGSLHVVNRLTDTEPGSSPKAGFSLSQREMSAGRNIARWNWDFGDGAKSTEQNPQHTYANNGVYNVSLLVSDGLNLKQEIKYAYIKVGPAGESEIPPKEPHLIYPNPASNYLIISSESRITSMTLFDCNGRILYQSEPAVGFVKLDTKSLENGLYILKLLTTKGILVDKFQILH